MNRSGRLAVLFVLFLTACVPYEPPETQATAVVLRQTEAAQNALALELQALQAEREATQKAAEMYAAQATADAFRAAQTAQALELTRIAEATAAERAWQVQQVTLTAAAAQATATAQMKQTEVRWTQTALDIQSTADAASVQALATSQAVNAGLAQEALYQERIRTIQQDYAKYAWAVLPFVLLGLLAVLGLLGVWLWKRNQVLTQLADGRLVLVRDGKVIIPDRSLYPVIDPDKPALPPVDVQQKVTENDQKVSAVRALAAGGKADTAQRLVQGMCAAQPQVTVRVIREQEARPLLGEAVNGIYKDAVEGEK